MDSISYFQEVLFMDNIRFFIRRVDNQFAIIVSTQQGELVVDRGALPLVKGKFIFYTKNREALMQAMSHIA
jgi:hypothetical protein